MSNEEIGLDVGRVWVRETPNFVRRQDACTQAPTLGPTTLTPPTTPMTNSPTPTMIATSTAVTTTMSSTQSTVTAIDSETTLIAVSNATDIMTITTTFATLFSTLSVGGVLFICACFICVTGCILFGICYWLRIKNRRQSRQLAKEPVVGKAPLMNLFLLLTFFFASKRYFRLLYLQKVVRFRE